MGALGLDHAPTLVREISILPSHPQTLRKSFENHKEIQKG
jgi:hypothetical protein